MSTESSTSDRKPLGSSRSSNQRSSLRRPRPSRTPGENDIPRVIFIPCRIEPLDRWSPEGGIPTVVGGGNTFYQSSKWQPEGRCSVSSSITRLEFSAIQVRSVCDSIKIASSVETHSLTRSALSGSHQDGSSSSGKVRRRSLTEPPSQPKRQHSSGELDLLS